MLKIIDHDLGVDTPQATIVPLADLHIGAPGFDLPLFTQVRDEILNTPNAYCLINGDVLEMATKGCVGNVYEAMRPRDQKELAIALLEPLANTNKILAYLDGNHESRASKDVDEFPGQYICNALGISELYDSDGAFIYLKVGYNHKKQNSISSAHKNRNTYSIFMLHGFSGARTSGGKTKQLDAMAEAVLADCYIGAHTHQKVAFNRRILIPETRNKTLNFKTQTFVNTGSFLNWEGYAVKKGYSPSALGAPHIIFSGLKHNIQAVI